MSYKKCQALRLAFLFLADRYVWLTCRHRGLARDEVAPV
jgi:hypothetical protein